MSTEPIQRFQPGCAEALPVIDRDVWISCALCCGLGGWEEGRPQHDDPNFAISIKCPSCNGAGWECK